MQFNIILVFVLLDCVGIALPSEVITGKYCHNFNVTCNEEEVILMLRAVFGRMAYGQCLERNNQTEPMEKFPNLFGCSGDILNYMTDKCSGNKTCYVSTLYNIYVDNSGICSIPGYLEAEHKCIKAHTDTCTLYVSKTASIISKSKATECKTLKLITSPSLSIEIIPIYFIGHDEPRAQANGRVKLGDVHDGENYRLFGRLEIEMGNDGSWTGVPLKIDSSSITVHFKSFKNATKWMLNVTARGCDDFTAQNETSVIERTPTNVTVKCLLSGGVWTVVCSEDGQWVGGKECKSKPFKDSPFKAYSGVVIAGSASLAVVVGVAVVFVSLCMCKRRTATSNSNSKDQPRKKKMAAEFLYKDGDHGAKDFMDNRFSTTAHQQLEPPGMDLTPEIKPQHSMPLSVHPPCPMHGFIDPTSGKIMQFNTMGYHPHHNPMTEKNADGLVHPVDFNSFTMRYHHLPPHVSHHHPANRRIHPDLGKDFLLPQPPPKDPSRAYFTQGSMHQIYYPTMHQPYTCNPYFGTIPTFGIYCNEETAPIYNTLDPFPLAELVETVPQRTPESLLTDQPTDLTMARKKLTLSREDIMAAEKAPWEEMK